MLTSQVQRTWRYMIAVGISLVLFPVGWSMAETGPSISKPDVSELSSWPLGHVTGVAEKAVEIDYRPYGMHADVKIIDPQGTVMELKDLQRTYPVRYHLKGEKLDYLVIVLAP